MGAFRGGSQDVRIGPKEGVCVCVFLSGRVINATVRLSHSEPRR